MRALLAGSLTVVAVCLTGCGPSANASLSGKVAFADDSDATGLNVQLVGPAAKQTTTGSGGSYSFEKLVPGIYLVTVDAANTQEGHLSAAIEVKGATMVPALTFNALGNLKGTVSDSSGNPAAGAEVFLTGSDRATLTDDAGNYAFINVPAGVYGLSAKLSSPPQLASATMVAVKRGDNMGPMLMLMDDTNAYGTLKGTLSTFTPQSSPMGLHAAAGGISVNTDATGAWSLSLPPGNYEVVAGGGAFPDQSLGRFDVRSGDITVVPVHSMSIYHAIPDASVVDLVQAVAYNDSFAALQNQVEAGFAYELVLVDLHSFITRLIAVGYSTSHAFSSGGKWLSFRDGILGDSCIAYNVATAKMLAMPVPGITNGPIVSTDETVMLASTGDHLYRMDLSTGTVTTLPITAGTGFFMSPDRFVYRSVATTPFDVMMVGPTGTPTAVLSQQTSLAGGLSYSANPVTSALGVIWASQICMPNCTVQVLTSTQSTPMPVSGNTIVGFPTAIVGSTRDWLGFAHASGRILVKTQDGSSTPLPATTSQLIFNESETRVAFYTTAGDVREDSVPPNAAAAVAISGPIITGAYLSPTRFMVFVNGTTSKRADIRTGTPTSDGDVELMNDSPQIFPPGATWVKKTSQTRLATVYDQGTDFTLPGIVQVPFVMGGQVGGLGSYKDPQASGLGHYAVVSDESNHYVLDGPGGMARLEQGETLYHGILPFPVDRYRLNLTYGNLLRTFDDTRTIDYDEPQANVSMLPTYLPGGKVFVTATGVGFSVPRLNYYVAVTP